MSESIGAQVKQRREELWRDVISDSDGKAHAVYYDPVGGTIHYKDEISPEQLKQAERDHYARALGFKDAADADAAARLWAAAQRASEFGSCRLWIHFFSGPDADAFSIAMPEPNAIHLGGTAEREEAPNAAE